MLLENDEAKKAVACFERVIKADPANVEALKVLGHLYAKEGREAEALKVLTKATEHDSSDAAVWLDQGALELLAEQLRLCQLALSELTGELHSDDLLGAIFSRFCIGK
jgi:tRNA modification GTPase